MTSSRTSKLSSSVARVGTQLAQRRLRGLTFSLLAFALGAPAQRSTTPVSQSLPSVSEQWTTYNGDFSGRRFSTLDQINAGNVKALTLSWAFSTKGLGIKGTPLVIDGTMFLTVPDKVWAIDAETGVKLWEFDRPSEGNHIANRGVAFLDGKVFFGTTDAHMIALDAKTGKVVWDHEMADSKFGYYIATSPLAIKGKIIFGTSGDVADVPHFMAALDPATGKEIWRLHTIPKPGEPGFETWPNAEAAAHGGGPLWVTGTYDPALNLMFWGTGNPHPVLAGDVRKGANLYTCSILAIDPDTGKIKWHYQPSPHDTHDWDAVETPVLFDADWKGADGKTTPRKLLAHGSRNGYFFILDRTTGEHLLTSQFIPTDWAKGLDTKGQPISDPQKEIMPGGALVHAVANGVTNWYPPSYDPQTGLFYLNGQEGWSFWYSALDAKGLPEDHQGGSAINVSEKSLLVAMDTQTGKVRWQREAGESRVQTGVLTTAGHLLFTGDSLGNLLALDPTDGKTLWHTRPGTNSLGGPMTYQVKGKQYVTMAAGDTLYTFALPTQ
ncbi:MAG: acido-empty-quinoprotein group A [Janthinobacterium lividum]